MVTVETIAKVRRLLAKGTAIKETARRCCVSRNTVRKIRDTEIIEPRYKKRDPRPGIIEKYAESLQAKLEADLQVKPRERRKIIILFEELQREGYTGSYDTVRRFVKAWQGTHKSKHRAYIPLLFQKGEAFQFDWSTETVVLNDVTIGIQVAHFRLCYSRMSFLVAFPRQSAEMVLEAHVKAHDFFGGLCERGIYDNPKTIVTRIGRGRERDFNSRFMTMASYYLFEPTACTPASGNEKGQVEQQVDTHRDHIFSPRLRFKNYEELNAHLAEQCTYWAMKTKHPEFPDRTIWEVYQEEKAYLRRQPDSFEAYSSVTKRVTSTCCVRHDRNYYSVPCEYANLVVEVRSYADKIVLAYEGKAIATHQRRFDRGGYSTKIEHYLPLLKRKPGAVRNGRPFVGDNLPSAFAKLRAILCKSLEGEKQFAHILLSIITYGYDAVLTATELMLDAGCANEATILNAVSRLVEEQIPQEIMVPQKLILHCEPQADCRRYDALLGV